MIPLLDTKAQYQSLKGEIDTAVLSVLASGHYVLGEEVAAFEEEFASYCGVRHAVAVNTGTSALHLALLAAGVGPGDEVITVPFTFVATVSSICYTGARPVFVDVETATLTMNAKQLEAAITTRTKAIIPVHLYGQMADMTDIVRIADQHGIPVIEDACQAHGARLHGHRAGSLGISGCFSFYPGKNLGACGEAGIVVTNNDDQARAIRMLRDWGQEQRYHHVIKGYNYRMDNIQGAILRVKLRRLDAWTDARRARASLYSSLLTGLKGVRTPIEAAHREHVYHVYAIRCWDRLRLQGALMTAGIQSGLHYPIPVHLQKAHADLGYTHGDFPVAEAASQEVLSLPIYPEMTFAQVEQVASAVIAAEHDAFVH